MDTATRSSFTSLEGHSVAQVEVLADSVELGVPDSEGWRVVISAKLDEQLRPTLVARWDPGLRRLHAPTALHGLVARLTAKRHWSGSSSG